MILFPSDVPWLNLLRRYLFWSAGLHLIWEIVQLPLFTLWRTGTAREITFAVLHCTAGDLMIAALALLVALLLVGEATWPQRGSISVGVVMLGIGIGYTIYSEWVNTVVRQSWAYTPIMPTLPWFGTGISPLMQWLVVPLIAMRLSTDQATPYPKK
ncbi:MAG: hypothetical protein ABL904_13790 [Hyphomicrobiaceae bacterium]